MFSEFSARSRMATLALFGGLLAASFAAAPVSAATITPADCAAQSGEVAVEAVAISQGRTLVLQATPPDGSYVGTSSVHIFCQDPNTFVNLGDITGASVNITINPTASGLTASMFSISSPSATTTGNPLTLGPFDGTTSFTVTAASNLLPPGVAAEQVAVDIQVVTTAWSTNLFDSTVGVILSPGTTGNVLAKTPELDSIALFATGAVSLAGYALLRRRARGSNKD